jgi:hypothetical protein
MLSDTTSDVKFEIGHVLFIDIVGYSKLLINEQSDQGTTGVQHSRKESRTQLSSALLINTAALARCTA